MYQHVFEAGQVRSLGLLEQPEDSLCFAWPVQSGPDESLQPLPEHEWKSVDLTSHVQRVHDQGSIGMCASSATVQCYEVSRSIAGLRFVPLSAGDLYRRVSGGVDRGSLPEDNLMQLLANGVMPEYIVPYHDWRRQNEGLQARKHYRGLEAHLCPSPAHVITALMMGFPCLIGYWHHTTDLVSDEGWMLNPSGGRGGHAVCAVGVVIHPRFGVGVHIVNSWSDRWGKRGYATLPLRRVAEGIRSFQAWSLRTIVSPERHLPPLKE